MKTTTEGTSWNIDDGTVKLLVEHNGVGKIRRETLTRDDLVKMLHALGCGQTLMTAEAGRALLEMLEAPAPEPTEALKRAAKDYMEHCHGPLATCNCIFECKNDCPRWPG